MTAMPGQKESGPLLQKPPTPAAASAFSRISPFHRRIRDLGAWDAIFTHPIEYSLSSYKTREGIQQLFCELESRGFSMCSLPKGIRHSSREFYFNRNMCNSKPTGKSAYGIFIEFRRNKVRVMYTDPLAPEKGGNRLKAGEVLINREYKFSRKTGHWTMHDGRHCDNAATWITSLCDDICTKASHKPEDVLFANMHGHWGRDIDGKRLIRRCLDDGFSPTKDIIRNFMLWNVDIDATGFHNHFSRGFFNYVRSLEKSIGITKVAAFELTAPVVLYDSGEVRKFMRSVEQLNGRLGILRIGDIERRLRQNKDGTWATESLSRVIAEYGELAKIHNIRNPRLAIKIPSFRPKGYDEGEIKAFIKEVREAGIGTIPVAKLASRLVPKGDGTYPFDIVRSLAFACESSVADYNRAHPFAHITLPLQSTGEYDPRDVARFISSLKENGAQMRDVGAARLVAKLKRRPEGGYYLRDTEAIIWAFSNSVTEHNWLLAKIAQKEGKSRAEQIRIPKPAIMGYDMREAQAFLAGLKQNSASLETLALCSLERRLNRNRTNGHYAPADVRAVITTCCDAVRKHNWENPEDRVMVPQPRLNGPHFMVYCATPEIAEAIDREVLSSRTAKYPAEAPSWEMKEMLAGMKAKYGLKISIALSHPRANRPLNDDMVHSIANGTISSSEARRVVGTYAQAVCGLNALNRKMQVVEPEEFRDQAEAADIMQIFHRENAEMNGALGKMRTPNSVSWAFARHMSKKYQTAVIFEPDAHYYPPVRCGRMEMGALALGHTALRGSARKSAAAFVLHMNAFVMFNRNNPLVDRLVGARDSGKPFVSRPEIQMEAFYEPDAEGILGPVPERTRRTFLQKHLEYFQKTRVYGMLAPGILLDDARKRIRDTQPRTLKEFWDAVLGIVK